MRVSTLLKSAAWVGVLCCLAGNVMARSVPALTPVAVPDGGSSMLLLGVAIGGVALVRTFFYKKH
jgi:hypothetical protein